MRLQDISNQEFLVQVLLPEVVKDLQSEIEEAEENRSQLFQKK